MAEVIIAVALVALLLVEGARLAIESRDAMARKGEAEALKAVVVEMMKSREVETLTKIAEALTNLLKERESAPTNMAAASPLQKLEPGMGRKLLAERLAKRLAEREMAANATAQAG